MGKTNVYFKTGMYSYTSKGLVGLVRLVTMYVGVVGYLITFLT